MIPDVTFLKSSVMTHKFADLFNPPGITNFMGVLQTEIDPTGISSLNFPPFAMAGNNTANLYINDRFYQATGRPVSFVWYPDRVERFSNYQGFEIKTITTLAVGQRAAIIRIEVKNSNGSKKDLKIRLGAQGGITQKNKGWVEAMPPSEANNKVEVEPKRKALIYSAQNSKACVVQGMYPAADKITAKSFEYTLSLKPGESWKADWVAAVAESNTDALNLYDRIAPFAEKEIEKARQNWNDELKAIFTPENERFSGSLPELNTTNEDILRLYAIAALGVVYFKRDVPESVYGRAYDTLLPRYWQSVTFIWDYALSSFVHALLDPAVMKKYLEYWMKLDIHKHFGTEYLTGGPVGYWYAANDFNMMVLIKDYLRWSGNYGWLDTVIDDPAKNTRLKVADYIESYATGWKKFKSPAGLADYGEIDNLMECVSTYIHEVASLNAANVFNLRTASQLLKTYGQTQKAQNLAAEGQKLVNEFQKLYATGKGHWYSRFPDGKLVDVRHCYDFFTILNTVADDLSSTQKNEMVQFFQKELQTESWMRALAPSDDDAMFSVRPDHQWNGAYPAWPAHSLNALYKAGKPDLAFEWLSGLAKSFNQGPLGQAHFVADVIDSEQGGARKAPFEIPYQTDWACSGGGSWVSVIIESLFGVKAQLNGGISAIPQFGSFDPQAELNNLVYRGKKYNVSKKGLREL